MCELHARDPRKLSKWHLLSASFILRDLTHFGVFFLSAWTSSFILPMAEIFRSSAKTKGWLKVRTSGRSFIKCKRVKATYGSPVVLGCSLVILSMCDLQFARIVFADLGSRI